MPATTSGRAAFGPARDFNGVKVFSATMVGERDRLGERVTAWLDDNPAVDVREIVVTQSSDEAFHCLAITLFYFDDARK